ncbi:sigma-70 family RNA polymerase sigma factor [Chitinophaga sp.]|uniref:RNA polymerase sigma factor n=1 Tax=Chitinophaga sp. TaxID=1869181 RepID=UPI0031D67877
MEDQALLPYLFRTEYRKIIAVLCQLFGIAHIEIAEDIVSDTFLSATELWSQQGIPPNPVAWLYTVAKRKTLNHLKRDHLFSRKIRPEIAKSSHEMTEMDIDLSDQRIHDSQLAMIFTVCHPGIPEESQVALALNLLCGFGAQEIADAFLTNKDVIYKRLQRAKEKLKADQIPITPPSAGAVNSRLDTVLTTLYLLFSEGYYSTSQDTTLRKDLCLEAMRLTYLLVSHPPAALPAVNALLSLMCFHASRFEARADQQGGMILYDEQDTSLWNQELIVKGTYYLNEAASGGILTKYHLEAGIAYWHTHKEDSREKWVQILYLYDQLVRVEPSPIAALNRIYALAKVNGNAAAIEAAALLPLTDNHFYYALLGHLYTPLDRTKAMVHFRKALSLAVTAADKEAISRKLR